MALDDIQLVDAAERVSDLSSGRTLYSIKLAKATTAKAKVLARQRANDMKKLRKQIDADVAEGINEDQIIAKNIYSAVQILELNDNVTVLEKPGNSTDPVENINARAIRVIKSMAEWARKKSEKIYSGVDEKQAQPNTEVITIPSIELPNTEPTTEIVTTPVIENPTEPTTEFISLKKDQSGSGSDEISKEKIRSGLNAELDALFNREPKDNRDGQINAALETHIKQIEEDLPYSPMTTNEITVSRQKIGEFDDPIKEKAKAIKDAAQKNAEEVARINAAKGYVVPTTDSDSQLRDEPIVIPGRSDEGKEDIPNYTLASNIKENDSGFGAENIPEEKTSTSTIIEGEVSTMPVVVSSVDLGNLRDSRFQQIRDALKEQEKMKTDAQRLHAELEEQEKANAGVRNKEAIAQEEVESSKKELDATQKKFDQACKDILSKINGDTEKIAAEIKATEKRSAELINDTENRRRAIEDLENQAASNRRTTDDLRAQTEELTSIFEQPTEPNEEYVFKK